jgi:hypothetical protein
MCAKNKSEPNSIRFKSSDTTFLAQNIIVGSDNSARTMRQEGGVAGTRL